MDRNPANVTAAANISSTINGGIMAFEAPPLGVDGVRAVAEAPVVLFTDTVGVGAVLTPVTLEWSSDVTTCDSSTSGTWK